MLTFREEGKRVMAVVEHEPMAPGAGEDEKALGLPTATTLVIGTVVGIGIFTLPSSMAHYGLLGLLGFVMATIGALTMSLVFSALSARIPAQGGPYAYARDGFGDVAGFLNAFAYWCCTWPGIAGIGISWAFYVRELLGWDEGNRLLTIAAALVGLWACAGINLLGIRQIGSFQMVVVILKFMPLVFLATVGMVIAFRRAEWPAWNPSGEHPISALFGAVTLTTFAYIGIESAAVAASKVRQPERNVPRATVLGTVLSAGVYLLVTAALFGIVPHDVLVESGAPFSVAFDTILGGGWSGKVVSVFAVISGFGAMIALTLNCGQVSQAAARDGLFPGALARENGNGVPGVAIVTSMLFATLAVVLALGTSGGLDAFNTIAQLAVVNAGLPYFFSVLAHLYFLFTAGRPLPAATGTFWREVFVALIALGFAVNMMMGAGSMAVYLAFGTILMGLVLMTYLSIRTGRYGMAPAAAVRPVERAEREMVAR